MDHEHKNFLTWHQILLWSKQSFPWFVVGQSEGLHTVLVSLAMKCLYKLWQIAADIGPHVFLTNIQLTVTSSLISLTEFCLKLL